MKESKKGRKEGGEGGWRVEKGVSKEEGQGRKNDRKNLTSVTPCTC